MPLRGFGMIRERPDLRDLIIVPAQVSKLPADGIRTLIDTETILGVRCERPLVLDKPIFLSSPSYGAVNKAVKMAFAGAAAHHGLALDTGEGGVTSEEKRILSDGGKLIVQFSTGRFGIDLQTINQADALEISCGQGSKAGMGGILFAEKITEEISEMRLLPNGADAISPPHHLDMEAADDLKYLVDMIREATDHRIPVIVKFSAGRIIDDVKAAVDAGVDAIAIEASEAMGTTVPDVVGNEAGTPLIGAIGAARRAFRLTGARDKGVKLLVSGGVRDASDVFKLLALGADAVGLDIAPLVALGCRGCFWRCPKGDCPAGLTSSSSSIDHEEGARKISNLIRAFEDELKVLVALSGHHTIDDLGPDDLRALTYDAAAISGAKLVGYERELPMWQH